MTMPNARAGRLAGKIAVITGAAGNLGGGIARRYVEEGASVVLTGRSAARVEAAMAAIAAATGAPAEQLACVVLDGADPHSVRAGIADVVARFGRIDILVNNAGSAGPKQTIAALPFTRDELEALRAAGSSDAETVGDALRNLLGVTWNLARAAAPAMPAGAAMINISTIFARTEYYGRAAYVVPKAALNALCAGLARELGARGVRVNTIHPGPIASERIRTVFAAMDTLRGDADGSTAAHFFGRMSLARALPGQPPAKTFPLPEDIAAACLFLGSDEAAAFNGHDFEVTHGLEAPAQSRATFLARPPIRSMDGAGLNVLVAGGEQWEEALECARIQAACGARVLVGLHRQADVAQAQARVRAEGGGETLTIARFNRADIAGMEGALAGFTHAHGALAGALFLPVRPAGAFAGPFANASDRDVESLLDIELGGALALARTLSRYWRAQGGLLQAPRFVFVSNASAGDAAADAWAELLAAGIEQLIRIWRDEAAVALRLGHRPQAEWGNQILRATNAEPENLRFAAGHAARILLRENRLPEISLALPASIAEATGARRALAGAAENITGLHLGKVALITGGSAGIGGQVARLLALAGAKVMMVARRAGELEAARARIIEELHDVGFSGVERRVQTLAEVDVADFASLERAVAATVAAFGRIDYLINNAGVAGAEDMVVDMDPAAWTRTLDANLVSNYLLAHHVAPLMRQQGSGYILNVSSYFGGEKFLAVAYPNRADYAVSKAGQRAMVEAFARHLGPEIQLNAIAPGPVDGDRLAGTGGKPGLFERRARLILENKRLNAVHAAVIAAARGGLRAAALLDRLARNDTAALSHDADAPRELRELALACAREGDGVCAWDRYLLDPPLAARLAARLHRGGWLADAPGWAAPGDGWLLRVPPAQTPFLPAQRIAAEAAKVRDGVLGQLRLGGMPTEAEVAQATVFFLADRAVSGETFMPSGGLSVERSTTERELFGGPKRERLDAMAGQTVWIIAEHLIDYVAETARQLVADCNVARVVLLSGSQTGVEALRAPLADLPAGRIETLVCGEDVAAGMDLALQRWGRPITVVSTPLVPLPDRLFEAQAPLAPAEFRAMVDANLTHHFRVARRASLYDACQLVLVSPDVPMGAGGAGFALANFIKTTLHAFTATLAVENERLVHDAPVNQINLTRRVRSEEPRTEAEHIEETRRFARAVLLLGAPLPDAEDSRYRARIYRGMSMTV